MRELTIKITIVDREYSLKVNPEEAELLRQASNLLNQYVKEKKERMKIQDKQDLLAIVAFDCIFERLLCEQSKTEVGHRIEALDKFIADSL